jgi:hypothetical protein
MKQKDIVFLIISGFIVIIFWIIFSVFHNANTSTISSSVAADIVPISPNFDTKTITILKQRTKIAPLFQAPTATPSATITPFVTQPTATTIPTTSGGGKLIP